MIHIYILTVMISSIKCGHQLENVTVHNMYLYTNRHDIINKVFLINTLG